MTLTPKQRAKLKGLANGISKRHLLGKAEPDEGFLKSLDDAFEAHELLKVGLLQTCSLTPKEAADMLEKKLDCGVVQVIGRVIVLYRPSKKHRTIEL